MLETAAAAYKDDGYHFYFADERMPSGGSTMNRIDGPAHGEEFWALANRKDQDVVNYTFVKGGKGYVKFDIDVSRRVVKSGPQLMKECHAYYEGQN